MKKNLKKIIPWVLVIGIFGLLFFHIPPQDILKTASYADWPLMITLAVAYFLIMTVLDVFGLKWTISRFATQVDLKETVLMRGATYLLMVINYNLGQGGIAFYLKRTHQTPLFKTLSSMFYLSLVDLCLLVTLSVIISFFTPVSLNHIEINPLIQKLGLFFYLCIFLWVIFWKNVSKSWSAPLRKIRWVHWLLEQHLFHAFRESSMGDYVKAILVRLPIVIVVSSMFYLPLIAFKVTTPIWVFLLYSPIVLLAGVLPLTPAGLGTSQALVIALFSHQLQSPLLSLEGVTAASILLASSLVWMFLNLILKCSSGFICLRIKSRHLFDEIPTSESPLPVRN